MRELNECEAEVFRRSEKRIKQRQRTRNRVVAWCIPLCFATILTVISLEQHDKASREEIMYDEQRDKISYEEEFENDNVPGEYENSDNITDVEEFGSIDSFSFSLTWDCYGISSYDSQTGKLIKTTDATNPEDYITTYRLTEEQKQKIYDLIFHLNITAYPDIYNPHADGVMSEPSMTLILSVNTDTVQKTVTAADIALTYKSDNQEGQEFLNVCKAIEDILTSTEEWESLPEYEFFYE